MARARLAPWVVALALVGCGKEVISTPPRGATPDAGSSPDAGNRSLPDAGSPSPVDAGPPPSDSPRLPSDVAIGEVSLYQAVKVSLGSAGVATARTAVPVVAGRAALVRVGVTLGAGFVSRTLGCDLIVDPGNGSPQAMHLEQAISQSSSDDTAASFFAFSVPSALITPSTLWGARLTDPNSSPVSGSTASTARLPTDGTLAPLGARTDAGGIQIVLVPVQWNADGSGRLPDTSAPQLATIETLLKAVYPLTEVDLTVHAPLNYTGGLTITGNINFSDINSQLQTMRQDDNAPDEAYYYALVEPADTFDDYCGGSCVTGQSFVVDDPTDASIRVGAGQGWSGDDSAWTLAHELGHEQGRYHAPCSAGNTDPDYPYADGAIGSWGYDPRSGAFLDPTLNNDFMGYCDNTWASDYTYSALFDRMLAVHGAPPRLHRAALPFRFLGLDGFGGYTWRAPLRLDHAPSGAQVSATWLDADGRALRQDAAPRLSISDGVETELALPAAPVGATAVLIDDAGVVKRYPVE